jgi:23S rRNA A2030 N6-methylase RlmJ
MLRQAKSSLPHQIPVLSVIHDALAHSLTSSDHLDMLQRLAARLIYLADTAQVQGKFDLEATMTRTAAEVLTSSTEIAGSAYAGAFIDRLIKSIRKIERNLDMRSARSASSLL